jgi:hypothetical protein
MNKEFEISDDACFLGLINTHRYISFVDENWEFDQIKKRIIRESNKGHLLFWGTELPNNWRVRICDKPVADKAYKEFEGKIRVSDSKLHLINYESIVIAAQFEEEKLPEEELADLNVPLDNAVYDVIIRQLFNPDEDEISEDMLGFEIVLQKSVTKGRGKINSFKELIWSEY